MNPEWEGRINTLIHLHHKAFPGVDVSAQTKIRGTTLEKLAQYNAGGYNRVRTWLEGEVKKQTNKKQTMELTPEQQKDVESLRAFFEGAVNTFIQKGMKYGNSWHELSIDSTKDLVRMKLSRADMTDEFEDAVNYIWMLKQKVEAKKQA